MNKAWPGRHILSFVTETFSVHKTNGENQWRQMAWGSGRKESDFQRICNTEQSQAKQSTELGILDSSVISAGCVTGVMRKKIRGLNTGILLLCPSPCTSLAS